MSTLDRITDMLPKTTIVFPISDPKKQEKELRSQWNAQCENLVSTILDTHRPAQVVFDGPTRTVAFSTDEVLCVHGMDLASSVRH